MKIYEYFTYKVTGITLICWNFIYVRTVHKLNCLSLHRTPVSISPPKWLFVRVGKGEENVDAFLAFGEKFS